MYLHVLIEYLKIVNKGDSQEKQISGDTSSQGFGGKAPEQMLHGYG